MSIDPDAGQWVYFWVQTYLKSTPREPLVIPRVIDAATNTVKVVPTLLVTKPDWYRAGYLTLLDRVGVERLEQASQIVLLQSPSVFSMTPLSAEYQVKFYPVPWLPVTRFKFYYWMPDGGELDMQLDGGTYEGL